MAKQDPYKKKLATASLAEAQAMDKAYADALKNKQKTYKYGTLEYAVQPEKARVLAADIVSERLKKPTTPATPTTTPKPPLPPLEPTKTTPAPTSTTKKNHPEYDKINFPEIKMSDGTIVKKSPEGDLYYPNGRAFERTGEKKYPAYTLTPFDTEQINKRFPSTKTTPTSASVKETKAPIVAPPEPQYKASASDTIVIRPRAEVKPTDNVHPKYKALRLPETKLTDGSIGKISPYGDVFYKNGRATLINDKGVKTTGNVTDPEEFNKYYDRVRANKNFQEIPKGYAYGGTLPQYQMGGEFDVTSFLGTGQTAAGATGTTGAATGMSKDQKMDIAGMGLQGASQAINMIDGMDGRPSTLGGVASGMASGASIGAVGGLPGMAIGAVIGGGLSLLQAEKAKKDEIAAKKRYMENLNSQAEMGSQQTLRNYASRGVTTSGAYAYGGELPQYATGGGDLNNVLDTLDIPQKKMMSAFTGIEERPSDFLTRKKYIDNSMQGRTVGLAADIVADPMNLMPELEVGRIPSLINRARSIYNKGSRIADAASAANNISQAYAPEIDKRLNLNRGASGTWAYGGNLPQYPYGGKTPHYGGLWDTNRKGFVDSTLNANRNLDFVKRLYEPNAPSIQLPFEPMGERSTHFMADAGTKVFPTVVRKPGQTGLEYLGDKPRNDPNEAYNYANRTGEYINFQHPDQASWFANNGYKKGTGVFNSINSKGRPYNNPRYADGGGIPKKDIYNTPITANIKNDPKTDRSYYDDRLNTMVLGSDYDNFPKDIQDRVQVHENYHAKQYDTGNSNFDIAHNTEDAIFNRLRKRPSMVANDEEYYNYHNRKPIESNLDIEDFRKNSQGSEFIPNDVIFNKDVDSYQYTNPHSLEGEAKYYENTGKDFSLMNKGTMQNQDGKRYAGYAAYGGYLPEYGKGGKIHIKKENRGKFTAYKKRTGKTTEEALHSKDPHVRQMANFARNAAKWKHPYGGMLENSGHENPYVQEPFNPNNQGNNMPNAQYEVEGGEMIQGQGQNQPMLEDGQQQQVASDMTKVPDAAPSHAEGGVAGTGGERVYSDRMKTANKKTYAEEAEEIGKRKAKYEAKIPSTNEAISNTGHRMTERMDMKLDDLFNEQEMKKQLALPPSISSSMPAMRYGGNLPKLAGGFNLKGYAVKPPPKGWGIDPMSERPTNILNKEGMYGNATRAFNTGQFLQPGQTDQWGNMNVYRNNVFSDKGSMYNTDKTMADYLKPQIGSNQNADLTGLDPIPTELDRNTYAKPNMTPTQTTGDMGGATGNALKNGNGIPWQYVDNLAQGIATANTPQLAKPYYDPAVKLNTTFDINPQLQEARNTRGAVQSNIRQNTVQGGAANSNMQQLYASSLDNQNALYAQKNNIENELKNREISLNSNINSRNNDKRYAYDVEDTKRRAGIQQDIVDNAKNFAMDQYTAGRDKKMDIRDMENIKQIAMANANSGLYGTKAHLQAFDDMYASNPTMLDDEIKRQQADSPNSSVLPYLLQLQAKRKKK